VNSRKAIPKKLRFEVFKRDRFTCTYCGKRPPKVELELDHVVAVSQGGEDTVANLTTSCVECNRGKRDRQLGKWLTRTEAMAALWMPLRTFARWLSKGMPSQGKGAAQRFPFPECLVWWGEQRERQGRESVRPAAIDEARMRLVSAEADLRELELGERRRELMTVAQYERVTAETYSQIRSQLKAIEARLPAMPGPWKTIEQRRQVIAKGLLELLEILYRANDIPEPEEVEAD
jgi:phage terminase Nu1 subunit (DNA packaging protein)